MLDKQIWKKKLFLFGRRSRSESVSQYSKSDIIHCLSKIFCRKFKIFHLYYLGVVHILRNQYFGDFYPPPPSVINRNQDPTPPPNYVIKAAPPPPPPPRRNQNQTSPPSLRPYQRHCMSERRPPLIPFATRARKRELCLQRYVSRMTRTENF